MDIQKIVPHVMRGGHDGVLSLFYKTGTVRE